MSKEAACVSYMRKVILSGDEDPRMAPGTWRLSHWLHDFACTHRHVDKYTGAPVRGGDMCDGSFDWSWRANPDAVIVAYMSHKACASHVTRNSDVFDVVLYRGVCVERPRHWHDACNS